MVDFSKHVPLDGSAPVAVVAGEVGTLGCFVRIDGGDPCILGSAHVLAAGSSGSDNLQVFQPPTSRPDSVQVAQLWDFYGPDLTGQTQSLLDAAVAVLVQGAEFSPCIGALGPPSNFNPLMVEGERVRIHGAGSGQPTGGLILELNATQVVSYEDGSQASFAGLARCERYSVAGDSGAAVLDQNNCVVGVHLCGSDDYSWFCPIGTVLARWPNMTLITQI